jgi:hypothetical protein
MQRKKNKNLNYVNKQMMMSESKYSVTTYKSTPCFSTDADALAHLTDSEKSEPIFTSHLLCKKSDKKIPCLLLPTPTRQRNGVVVLCQMKNKLRLVETEEPRKRKIKKRQ